VSRRFLAVDVGGTDVKWAVAEDGKLGEVERAPTRRPGAEQLVDQLRRLHAGLAGDDPLPWALCVTGLVDPERGVVLRSGSLALEDVPLQDALGDGGERPRLVANDVAAAALGEGDDNTLALLQIGSGVAGRSVVDGAVQAGVHGLAGELGHLVFVTGGRPCVCGLDGCVEAYAGMASIRRRYAELGRPAPSAAGVPADAARDRDAAEVLDDALRAIGFAVAALVSACDPGTVRLGGGVAAAWGETLRAAVEDGLRARVPHELSSGTKVELSRLGERAPLIGLLRLAGVQG
jgi:glucokinase